ncbi:hypothetical protein CHARACLAT_005218 [Characodon lateralis]|uniref:Uncharacterized protein n=1 Tax=Characodon lateralis TaxID=208331 RepID=A0ABU7F1N8_9TELE|nr:hypothetical protein [Characodon lateralis]
MNVAKMTVDFLRFLCTHVGGPKASTRGPVGVGTPGKLFLLLKVIVDCVDQSLTFLGGSYLLCHLEVSRSSKFSRDSDDRFARWVLSVSCHNESVLYLHIGNIIYSV